MAAPKYIKAKAEQLDRALAQVRKLEQEIIAYVEKQGVDGYMFSSDNKLDMAYEFDLEEALSNIDAVADGEYEQWD